MAAGRVVVGSGGGARRRSERRDAAVGTPLSLGGCNNPEVQTLHLHPNYRRNIWIESNSQISIWIQVNFKLISELEF
jgi:hypothetical protein